MKIEPKKIEGKTIKDLIVYLEQFPPNWTVFVCDWNGRCGEETYLAMTNISTTLSSKGPEVEF